MSEKPKHYKTDSGFDVIDFCEKWGIGFSLGSALKYLARNGKKDPIIQELTKAKDFIIRRMEYHVNGDITASYLFWEDFLRLVKDYELGEDEELIAQYIVTSMTFHGGLSDLEIAVKLIDELIEKQKEK